MSNIRLHLRQRYNYGMINDLHKKKTDMQAVKFNLADKVKITENVCNKNKK